MGPALQQSTTIPPRPNGKTVAIMQPYFLPYIGYWQMMQAVDEFVVYDDVQFSRGWINRNRLLWNGNADTFTLPLLKGSSRVAINERFLTDAWPDARTALLQKITHAYAKAPQFDRVFALIDKMLNTEKSNLADFLFETLRDVQVYLGIETPLVRASQVPLGDDLRAADRILALCKARGAHSYINAPGGRDLYDKEQFSAQGIDLFFIESGEISYEQLGSDFVPHLSILDVMMFNDVAEIRDMLGRYSLV